MAHKIINTKLSAINYRKNVKKHELFLNSMTSVLKPHAKISTMPGMAGKGTRK